MEREDAKDGAGGGVGPVERAIEGLGEGVWKWLASVGVGHSNESKTKKQKE